MSEKFERSSSKEINRKQEGKESFLKHILKAIPVILSVSVATFILGRIGVFRGFETYNLDTWMKIKPPTINAKELIIVEIDNQDYKNLFHSKSPLEAQTLKNLVKAIALGNPRVIGVDIETDETPISFAEKSQPFSSMTSIVWGRDAEINEENGEIEELHNVLGKKEPDFRWGLTLLPQDPDGVVRHYRRVFLFDNKKIDSLPWAVAKLFAHSNTNESNIPDEDLILSFSKDRYSFETYSASQVLAGSKGKGWSSNAGPLKDKIVLLGGSYSAARDQYMTTVGPKQGVEIIAQAIESDLHEQGIVTPNEIEMVLLEMGGGIILVILHYRFGHNALIVSLIIVPVLALLFSYFAFSSFSLWASFIPTLVAVLIHEFHHYVEEHHHLVEQHHDLVKENHRLVDEHLNLKDENEYLKKMLNQRDQ